MLPELTEHDYSAALDAVAGSVLCAIPLSSPPVDALDLARALGLVVAWDAGQHGRGRVVQLRRSGTARGSILLRPDPRRERLQWAIAHEIGETCAHMVFDHLAVDPREAPAGARERVANQLAGRLLLPHGWFGRDARACGWDVIELKQRYSTASHELVARRMLDFPPRIMISICDHGRLTFRLSNAVRRVPGPTPLGLAAWRAAHDGAQPVIEVDLALRVQAWPIHDPDWKREILRTELLVDDDYCDEA